MQIYSSIQQHEPQYSSCWDIFRQKNETKKIVYNFYGKLLVWSKSVEFCVEFCLKSVRAVCTDLYERGTKPDLNRYSLTQSRRTRTEEMLSIHPWKSLPVIHDKLRLPIWTFVCKFRSRSSPLPCVHFLVVLEVVLCWWCYSLVGDSLSLLSAPLVFNGFSLSSTTSWTTFASLEFTLEVFDCCLVSEALLTGF